jgi:hypothetical protein
MTSLDKRKGNFTFRDPVSKPVQITLHSYPSTHSLILYINLLRTLRCTWNYDGNKTQNLLRNVSYSQNKEEARGATWQAGLQASTVLFYFSIIYEHHWVQHGLYHDSHQTLQSNTGCFIQSYHGWKEFGFITSGLLAQLPCCSNILPYNIW